MSTVMTELGRIAGAGTSPGRALPLTTCCYGRLEYGIGASRRHVSCRADLSAPSDRFYCEVCGGVYCADHEDPSHHDCVHVIAL